MRVCILSYDYLPNSGGIAAHVHFLTCALVRAGHEVSLLACHAPDLPPPSAQPPIEGLQAWDNVAFSAAKWQRLSDAARRGRRLREWHHSRPFDLVHYHALRHDALAVQLAFGRGGPPRVFTNHSATFLQAAPIPWKRPALRAELARAQRVLAPSAELRDVTVSLGYPRDRCIYIPNGVDARMFTPAAQAPSDPTVLATRRLEHKNGMDLLIRAWPAVVGSFPAARLMVAGDGPERPRLERLAHQLGVADAVRFLGTVGREALPELYREASVCVLPSRLEAVSVSALEALASGLPVVATRVGGLPEVVRTGITGILAEPESPGSIAHAIATVLAMPDVGRSLGLQGRRLVEQEYGWDQVAARTVEVYDQCVAEQRTAQPA